MATGQSDSLFFTNSQQWNEDRYPEVKGSPYYFEDFVSAVVYRRDSARFDDITLNYNGYTKAVEVRQGAEFIELEDLWYRKIEVAASANDALNDDVVFEQDLHPTLKGKFRELVYRGKRLTVVYDFIIDKVEHTIQNPGKAVTFERFVEVGKFYAIRGTQMDLLRPKKDAIGNLLGYEKDLYKYLKSNKIKKLNEKENMAQVAAWYDERL